MPAFVKSKLVAVWKAVQVELQGEYSSQRVHDFFTYINEASSLQVFLAQLLTLLPCLVITAVVDLLPLRSVADGIHSNQLFFVRAFISFWLANTTTYNQFKHIVPQLPLSNSKIASYGALVAAITVSVMYGLTLAVGFPLPFSIITMSPIWLSLFVLPMAPWMIKSRTDSAVWPLVVTSLKVMVCQEVLVVVYPTYFYIFTKVPNSGKTYFALLLPLLKLLFRNAMAKTVGYLSDEVPEGVILNVEVVSALFVAYCMQNTPSLKTTMVLMVVDALQISASLYDIEIIIRRMKALRKRTNPKTRTEGQSHRAESEFNIAHNIFARQTTSRKASAGRPTSSLPKSLQMLSSSVWPVDNHGSHDQQLSIVPPPTSKTRSGPQSSDVASAISTNFEIRYVQELKKVLYITEFVVLLNYVEVIIPLIFSAYLLMMYHLPNRAYYKQIDASIIDYPEYRVMAQDAAFWVPSLIVCPGEAVQCSPVQNKLILWVFYNVQTALQHFGFDFEFTFAWLRGHTS